MASASTVGQGYSTDRPVPTIQKFVENQSNEHEEQQKQQAEMKANEAQVGESKEEVMDRMKKARNPLDSVRHRQPDRTVRDPTTNAPVTIKDAKLQDYPAASHFHSLRAPPLMKDMLSTKISPSPATPSNISLQPFPPPVPATLSGVMKSLNYVALFSVVSSAAIWLFVAFGAGWKAFLFRSMLCSGIGFVGATLAWGAGRKLEKEVEAIRMEMHKQRGEQFSPPIPESTEWLNSFISTIWRLINPDIFLPSVDAIEDVMEASLPGFVDAVRISDVGQGENAFRIISMRGLPDRPGGKRYPRKEWIDQGVPPPPPPKDEKNLPGAMEGPESLSVASATGHGVISKAPAKKANAPSQGEKDEETQVEQSGDYVNFEVAFAYNAQPGQGAELRSKNIHLLLEIFLGAYDWLHIPIPIWVQVESIAGTMRARIQFISEPPYVRNVTLTLMGVPHVEVSVTPLWSKLPNILDLPLISTFVKMAIKAGTASLVAPKSLTFNIQDMMSGSTIGDTRAVGVFLITLHHAEDLSAQDRNGRSDPYIVLAYAKFGKPAYSSRIILGDLNPSWEETTALLLTMDEVKSEEALSLMLWDSDAGTQDDLIGRIKVDVKDLMKNPNTSVTRTDPLMGFEDADKMQGKLTWSIGYYDKANLNPKLEILDEAAEAALEAAKKVKTMPEMEMRPGDKAPNPAAKDGPPPPPNVTRTPPDPAYKSGVLSVIIHQVNNLEVRNLKGTSGKDREGQAGQDTDDPSEQGNNLPSAYCELIINDDLVYKTRVKQYSAMPYFEAGTETFVRNWEETVVRIVVRNSALREKDPILGIVSIKLKDVLKTGSEVTRLFSLEEGIGFGRVNVSLLFRGVKLDLPQKQLGWDTGTVEIVSPIRMKLEPRKGGVNPLAEAKRLILSTTDSTEVFPTKDATQLPGEGLEWEMEDVRLPVYNRYQSSITFELHGSNVPLVGSKEPKAVAVLWLQELVDDSETEVRIPIIMGKDLKQLRQNYLNEFTKATHEYEIVGWLTTKINLDSGLDEDHASHSASQARRHAFETYDHIEGQALVAEKNSHAMDDGVLDGDEKKAIKRAETRQQQNRQRGVYGYKPIRTARWMKEGLKKRLHIGQEHKSKTKTDPAVGSEV